MLFRKGVFLSLFDCGSEFCGDLDKQVVCVDIGNASELNLALHQFRPKALILKSNQTASLSGCSSSALPPVILVVEESGKPVLPDIAARPEVTVLHCSSQSNLWSTVLAEIERALRPRPRQMSAPSAPKLGTVLVGSGIVNLITALSLRRAGHEVTVFDRMPDPMATDSFDRLSTGATFGGMDARIFSLNESRHHLFRGDASNVAIHQPFFKRVSDSGWLSRDWEDMSDEERAWIARLHGLPSWLSGVYNNDIISHNQESLLAWDALFSLHPQLLRGVNHHPMLLRVYQTESSFAAAQRLERHLGACHEVLPKEVLVRLQPSFAEAVANGAVVGALRVEGFSLNIKSFSRNIIRLLQSMGVRFHWNTSVEAICRDDAGRVTGLRIGKDTIQATNIVICPGAHAALSCDTLTSLSDIASMVGMWITLPNEVQPLTAPLKVRRRGFAASEAAEGANIIPGRDAHSRPVIYCSSGHGFVGAKPESVLASDLRELVACIEETAHDLFPDKYAEAKRRGMLDVDPAYCIRPWTSSGLGVFDRLETANGGQLILSGGHNTGGFAQAPSVARAVLAALDGNAHPMAETYHPERARAFLS